MTTKLWLTDDVDANRLMARSSLAVLVGALLDQQVPMEWAFAGPHTIAQRMGSDDLDASVIAEYDPEEFASILSTKPAVHRYPAAMAQRVQKLCAHLVEHYDGDADAVWRDAGSGAQLYHRLTELPGFGKQKSQVFVALLGKQLGVQPEGWREAAGDYGTESVFRSIADVTGPEALAKVRETKKVGKKRLGNC